MSDGKAKNEYVGGRTRLDFHRAVSRGEVDLNVKNADAKDGMNYTSLLRGMLRNETRIKILMMVMPIMHMAFSFAFLSVMGSNTLVDPSSQFLMAMGAFCVLALIMGIREYHGGCLNEESVDTLYMQSGQNNPGAMLTMISMRLTNMAGRMAVLGSLTGGVLFVLTVFFTFALAVMGVFKEGVWLYLSLVVIGVSFWSSTFAMAKMESNLGKLVKTWTSFVSDLEGEPVSIAWVESSACRTVDLAKLPQ